MFQLLGTLELSNSLTAGSTTIFGYLNEALPIAAIIGFSVIGVFAAWRIVKRMVKG